jgi:hypothetical protein
VTEDDFQKYMYAQLVAAQIRGEGYNGKVRPRVELADGSSMSIQASKWHYCTPREDNLERYSTWEVGYVTGNVGPLAEYTENDGANEDGEYDGVFPQVPTAVVVARINSRGGIAQ